MRTSWTWYRRHRRISFFESKLSCFIRLLRPPLALVGDGQVALLEVSWPALLRIGANSQITARKIVTPDVSLAADDERYIARRRGTVSMGIPWLFSHELSPQLVYSTPDIDVLNPGCCRNWHRGGRNRRNYVQLETHWKSPAPSPETNKSETERSSMSLPAFSWKVHKALLQLHVKCSGNW